MENQPTEHMPISSPYWDIAPRSTTGIPPRPPTWRLVVNEAIETIVLAAIIWLVINAATARVVVDGPSMRPNFTTGQLLIVNRLAYRFGTLQRGDVIVFDNPHDATDEYLIKRVVGLPGETVVINQGRVYISGELLQEPYLAPDLLTNNDGEWHISENSYFVLGDNRPQSHDSRSWGTLDKEDIVGKAWISYWPLSDIGLIPHYSYTSSQ
ncbi:MAG: signal peptidase I [Anaerolineae bacterium]|nr:signal peptidase I [Anaerolineae bacterium]